MRGRRIDFAKREYSSAAGASVYPFPGMKPGDWFLAPRDGERAAASNNADVTQLRIARAANMWCRRNRPGWKFSVTIADERAICCRRVV